jgi:hypothetical protein
LEWFVPSIRFRLDKPTLNGLAARVREEYGPEARIVDTEETLSGGFGGFFAKRVIDVTVELPDAAGPTEAHAFDMRKRVGLAALLEDADAQDLVPPAAATTAAVSPAGGPPVSTQRGDFASVLGALEDDVRRPEPPAPPPEPHLPAVRVASRPPAAAPVVERPAPVAAPSPRRPAPEWSGPPVFTAPNTILAQPSGPVVISRLTESMAERLVFSAPAVRARIGTAAPGEPTPRRARAGDLLLLVGLGQDAVRVANSIRDRMQHGYVCDGGSVHGNARRRVDDRRGALAARAYGVRSGQPVIVAFGLGDGDPDEPWFDDFVGIGGDQVWVVVDATRKTEDTHRWVGRLRTRVQVDAMASIRVAQTSTPESLAALGLPEAWSDAALEGRPD